MPFPAPVGSAEAVAEMLFGGDAARVDVRIHAVAREFLERRLERCPVGDAPTARRDVLQALYAYRPDGGSVAGATPAKLKEALEAVVDNPGDFSCVVSLRRRTVSPYLVKGAAERRERRMYRVKP